METDTHHQYKAKLDSPWGPLTLLGTEDFVERLAFPHEELAADDVPLRPVGALAQALLELEQFFSGQRQRFDVATIVDRQLEDVSFQLRALRCLQQIPYGHTITYGHLALKAGNPRAARAAGTACATNPVPILVPCHRVIRSDGTLGHYLGGSKAKRDLLELESC